MANVFGDFLKNFDLFGISGQKNPADPAMAELNKAIPLEKGYYDPFITRGNRAYEQLSPLYNQMTESPESYINALMGNYSPTDYYQLQRDRGLRALSNDAAAGGTRGSQNDIQAQTDLVNSLSNQDMQNWLKNAMSYQNTGMQGLQNIYGTGFDATKGLTGDISNILGTQAQLSFQGRNEAARQKADAFGGLGTLAGGLIGGYFGGPMGAAGGSSIGGGFGRMFGSNVYS